MLTTKHAQHPVCVFLGNKAPDENDKLLNRHVRKSEMGMFLHLLIEAIKCFELPDVY